MRFGLRLVSFRFFGIAGLFLQAGDDLGQTLRSPLHGILFPQFVGILNMRHIAVSERTI